MMAETISIRYSGSGRLRSQLTTDGPLSRRKFMTIEDYEYSISIGIDLNAYCSTAISTPRSQVDPSLLSTAVIMQRLPLVPPGIAKR